MPQVADLEELLSLVFCRSCCTDCVIFQADVCCGWVEGDRSGPVASELAQKLAKMLAPWGG